MTGISSARPVIIAIDGRSGAGKTTIAVELAALLREHHSVSLFHLEDLYPGWAGLRRGMAAYRQTVLEPLHRGRDASWTPWDWGKNAGGRRRSTAVAEIVIVEGVGAAHAEARAFLDLVLWVEADPAARKERALARDGDSYAPYWDQWAAQESSWLAIDQPQAAADIVLSGPVGEDAAEQVLRAAAGLPSLHSVLGPERLRLHSTAVHIHRVDAHPDPAALFERLYGRSPRAVWLDSSNSEGTQLPFDRNRFSIMADDGGRFGQSATHRAGVTTIAAGALTSRVAGPFFRWLDSMWVPRAVPVPAGYAADFTLGWLGYLGYELKRETGGRNISSSTADAGMIFAGRAVVYDHGEGCIYLLALSEASVRAAPDSWIDDTERTIESLARNKRQTAPAPRAQPPVTPAFTARDTEAEYLELIRRAQAEIAEGNSYEICLTTQLVAEMQQADPWQTYLCLRSHNPAPFAGYLRLDELTVASTSPERFLRIRPDGAMQAEPIKGTRRRHQDPVQDAALSRELATSAKDRAENIMIVDLLRNDLSHFAVPGTVGVSRLCEVESYSTVHQLVSTIDAQLRPGADRAAAVAAAFPPGSMTGAPKISTMSILDRLESTPRGVYSGAIGYFSLNGSTDLSVTIRTLVLEGGAGRLSLGVGGAITADSDPAEEWREVQTKASGVLAALGASFPCAPHAAGRRRRYAE